MTSMHETDRSADPQVELLFQQIKDRTAAEAIKLIENEPAELAGRILARLHVTYGFKILNGMPAARSDEIAESYPSELSKRWLMTRQYPEDSLGRLMEEAHSVFTPESTVRDAIEVVRRVVRAGNLITYGYVTDGNNVLKGIVVMRDLMLAEADQRISEIMIRDRFQFHPDTTISDAMKTMARFHVPVYPICDSDGRLVGVVKGNLLFEEHAFELSAQSGRMVGVGKEEMLHTNWRTSLRFRHPWLQLNLLTAFIAAAVVSLFENTITQIVLLAAFLPVLAGQSGNTGCQSLAVTLRGMALGHFTADSLKSCLRKEFMLGLCNGALVGITAGIAMYAYASSHHNPSALMLGIAVFTAMVGSCVLSGVTGVLVPTILRRLGADPATASSIFLTTFTDVASMGLFLWLATRLVL